MKMNFIFLASYHGISPLCVYRACCVLSMLLLRDVSLWLVECVHRSWHVHCMMLRRDASP